MNREHVVSLGVHGLVGMVDHRDDVPVEDVIVVVEPLRHQVVPVNAV